MLSLANKLKKTPTCTILRRKMGSKARLGQYIRMVGRALKIINKCWNIKISFYLETSDGQRFNLNFNAVYFFNTKLN